MRIISLHDKTTIASLLRRNLDMRLYEIGDLDDFFWPSTNWYALEEDGIIHELALAYNGGDLLVVLAQVTSSPELLRTLLSGLGHLLPKRFYSHLPPGMADCFGQYAADGHGLHDKMSLMNASRLSEIDSQMVVRFTPDDLPALHAFYQEAYPGNWFDPRMLETGHYYGYYQDGAILSVAGVHVYSPSQRVAALGNITTHPAARGRGLATIVTAQLCKELLGSVDRIGLNVLADNAAAIACYKRVGFERVGQYEEWMFT
jgi:ribosomal protein S18 acetylase RimI-like enzyme